MSLEGKSRDQLRSIVQPFDVDRVDVSIVIEGVDGQVIASAGLAAAGDTAKEIRREIAVAGEVIGNVIGRGSESLTLMTAIVESLAATASAIGAASSALEAGTAQGVHNARLEAELALARKIQRSFVPIIPPDIPGYEVAGHYEAAREVGGDFFDVFQARGQADQLAICVADVTGKGIAAALLMAFTRPLLHAAVDNAPGPADALERTNRILVEERRSTLFVTALCAVVDLRHGTVRLANAGHEPPLLVAAGGGPITWLEASGPLLGVFAPLDLAEQSISLEAGDLLLFYTDGVTDAQAPSGERFGDARLVETVEGSRGGTAADVVATVRDAYHQFQAEMPAADDVTIVAIRRNSRVRGGRGPS